MHGATIKIKKYVSRNFRKIAKSDSQLRPVCLSVHPSVCLHGTSRFPLEGFPTNLISVYFSKIYQENSNLIKISPE
jgi:hypothetical protein